jgi:hypothetical protein
MPLYTPGMLRKLILYCSPYFERRHGSFVCDTIVGRKVHVMMFSKRQLIRKAEKLRTAATADGAAAECISQPCLHSPRLCPDISMILTLPTVVLCSSSIEWIVRNQAPAFRPVQSALKAVNNQSVWKLPLPHSVPTTLCLCDQVAAEAELLTRSYTFPI